MTDAPPEFGQADLSNCDREPIHVPGSIQPHGLLLCLRPADLVVLQVAGRTRALLGLRRKSLLGRPLADLLGAGAAAKLRAAAASPDLAERPRHLFALETAGVAAMDLRLHAGGGLLLAELEPAEPGDRLEDGLSRIQAMLARLQLERSVQGFCQAAAEELRAVIGFDRVMVYRFLEDGSGWVFAEDVGPGVESYLGLHYPASDIPRQARELYRRNWFRQIPDLRYRPAPITPPANPLTGAPLDLSLCDLRSVSPVHRQYLRNMGVGASMSLSILVEERLWGLIACHHLAPRRLPSGLRAACALFAQLFSLKLEARLKEEGLAERLRRQGVQQEIAAAMTGQPGLTEGLLACRRQLLDLVPADGVALWIEGRCATLGTTPEAAEVGRLADWLAAAGAEPIFATDRFGEVWPPARRFAAIASGVLAMAVSRRPGAYVFWFRREMAGTVVWAGDPRRPARKGRAGRLTPRRSFQAWQEIVRGRSRPWQEVDRDAAATLRLFLLDVVLHRFEQVERERASARRRQEMLLAELDHRVKNTLANIQALVHQTRGSADSLESFIRGFEGRIRSMAAAHTLLSQSAWEGIRLRRIVEGEIHAFGATSRVHLEGPEVTLAPKAALSVGMALHELFGNAVRHGALSAGGGEIELGWRLGGEGRPADLGLADLGLADLVLDWQERGGPIVSPALRRGFGRRIIEDSLAYELGAEVALELAPAGLHCRIRLPAAHLAAEAGAGQGAAPSSRRILVVEDSALQAREIQAAVEALGWQAVGPASGLARALALAGSERLDGAVLDVDLGGDQVVAVADLLAERGVPFIFATGYELAAVLPPRFRDRPMVGKPYSRAELATALRRLLPGA